MRYLLDSSALWRLLRNRDLHEAWRPVVADGYVLSCSPQRAEFLRSARDAKEYRAFSDMFADLYDDVPVPKSACLWIGALQQRAADQGAHRALSVVDLQICATAAHHGLVVLHDDADFVTAARFAVELSQHNVHDGPRA
ncbi:PIN domain-containing protein [Streptomyces triticisoli]|jgi:predicted nucleic acid-binding protein|uniref:PIN domain-containing protein n=1 Tax=Streptomyces triticisoli TaxID=2182797 RepID=UPI0018E54C04|nr:PIN domain-containing protein [Streptomyces triticisoli]